MHPCQAEWCTRDYQIQTRTLPLTTNVNCSAKDIYVELKNIEMEATNNLLSRHNDINDGEKGPMINDWLGRGGLQLIKTLTVF